MRKNRVIIYAALIGLGFVYLAYGQASRGTDGAGDRPSGRGFTSYDLPMPKVMPVVAYDAH